MRFVIMAFLLTSGPLAAQSSDWNDLRQLNYSGESVSVQTDKKITCHFDYVTDSALFCRPYHQSFLINRSFSFPRQEVREVRLASRGLGAARGALVGVAIGATLGAARNSGARGGNAILGGFVFGLAGSIAGPNLPVQGQVIYSR